jgi:enoyl-CoA hydratase/carnithine racemase
MRASFGYNRLMEPAYFSRYEQLAMRRDENGILEVRLHTRGGPCLFGPRTHEHMVDAFYDISRDADTRLVILTGTGDSWIAAFDESQATAKDDFTVPRNWDRVYWEGKKVLQNLLDIDVPMIAAVNGPALVHSEYILTCDIVVAASNVVFQDLPHLAFGLVPGDGVHVLWPHVLGPVRGRYFLATQQKIEAQEALRLGVVNEVLEPEALMPRAWALARQLAALPTLTLRYMRVATAQRLKELVVREVGHGLALQGLSGAALGNPGPDPRPQDIRR